ncbi:hypothetical protein [Paenibacillus sp. P3E]|uniref:hypothetical protein n=1 Tax=Paenibacillus sp. P3E TaxID=1349435 RepID=UPI000AD08CBA|nr:hypothetical protein [Paenibacillus sp. P3E]
MKKGDKVRNRKNPNVTAIVHEVENKYVPGFGFGRRIKITQGMHTKWEPAGQWEVIKE